MYASPRRVSRRDVELGVRPSREVLSQRAVRLQRDRQIQTRAIEQFVRHHQVGDVVSATVIRSKGKQGDVLLANGVHAHVEDCLDHESGQKVQWLPVPAVGQRIQVYVRVIKPRQCRITVSIHSFTHDARFNLFNAGYRSSFDGTAAGFAQLPWEKPWSVRRWRRS